MSFLKFFVENNPSIPKWANVISKIELWIGALLLIPFIWFLCKFIFFNTGSFNKTLDALIPLCVVTVSLLLSVGFGILISKGHLWAAYLLLPAVAAGIYWWIF